MNKVVPRKSHHRLQRRVDGLELRCELQHKIHWSSNSIPGIGNVRVGVTVRHIEPRFSDRNKLRHNSDDPKLPPKAFFFNLEHWTAAVAAVYRAIENDCPSFFVRACHHASTKQWLIIVDLRNGLKAD